MHTKYTLPVSLWRSEPLENDIPDDDDVYTDVQLLRGHEVEVAEVTECRVRAVYEGKVDIHGNPDSSMLLPGGLKDGRVFGVSTVVKGIDWLAKLLRQLSDGEYDLEIIEILRPRRRQWLGNRMAFGQILQRSGVTTVGPREVLLYGRDAKKIFSPVRPDKTTTSYTTLFGSLQTNMWLLKTLRDAAGLTAEQSADAVLTEFVDYAASLDWGFVAEAKLDLPASHIVHGGGAFDAMVTDAKGNVFAHAPFDYTDAEVAGYRFIDNDANYPILLKKMAADPVLAKHYQKMGFPTPESFTLNDWHRIQAAIRFFIRLVTKVMGGTTYKDEFWHCEYGTVVSGLDSKPLVEDTLASSHPLSGGTGYTAIKQGVSGTAVWHTQVTEAALRKRGLLEE